MKLHIDIDYKNNVFELPVLTRIIGEPTTATLLDLRNEIRCNAQSVTTTLGGGQYGHLGLVMSNNLYTSLTNAEEYIKTGQSRTVPSKLPRCNRSSNCTREGRLGGAG